MLSPTKMKIIKVTTRTSLEKKLLRTLHDHSEIEFIDVEKKGLGSGTKVSESEDEKEVLSLLSKVSAIVDSLEMASTNESQQKKKLDFEQLADTLNACRKVYDSVSPDFEEISSHISEAQRKITDLNTLVEMSKILKPLNVEFGLIGEGKYFNIITGSVGSDKIERLEWNLKELTDESIIFSTSRVEGEKNLSAIVIGALHKFTDDINRVLASFGFVELSLPTDLKGNPEKVERESLREISKLQSEVAKWEEKKLSFKTANSFDLLSVKEQLTLEKDRIEAKRMMRFDGYVLQFWGYVPETEVKTTEKLIKTIDPDAIFEIEKKEFHDDKYPTRLKNNKYIGRPYEPMVLLYGTPDYKHDYDPSTLISITFPIFFGIMFADIFHGFLLILLGIYAMKMKPLGKQPVGMVDVAKDYLKKGSFVITISGVFSFIFGFFFWSFAGMHGPEAPSFMQGPNGLLWPLHFLWLFSDDTKTYSAFGNANGQFLFLQLSLFIGIIHIGVALFLLLIKKIQHKHYVEAFFFPLMLLIAYLSASLLVFSYGLNFIAWFTPPSPTAQFNAALLIPLIGYNTGIMIPAVLAYIVVIALITFIVYEIITMGLTDGISLGADFAISLLGNTVSYARLFAINLVHAILATLVYLIFSIPIVLPFDSIHEQIQNPNDPMQQIAIIFAFIAGTVLIISFELMVTFLQALRLHIVEFFSKMHFSGTGRLFNPFKSHRIFTESVSLPIQSVELKTAA